MVAVTTDIIINLPKEKVTEFAANPDNVPQWYVQIQSVEWQTPRPLQNGSELLVKSRFLRFVHKVVEFIPGQKLILRSVEGPIQLETALGWQAIDEHTTRMTISNRGLPKGFSRLLAPFIALMLGFINRRDLKHLKRLLERPVHGLQVV